MNRKLQAGDTVRNIKDGKLYSVEKVEKCFDVDSGRDIPTGRIICNPYDGDINKYLEFNENDLELENEIL